MRTLLDVLTDLTAAMDDTTLYTATTLDSLIRDAAAGPDFQWEWERIRWTEGIPAAHAWMTAHTGLYEQAVRLLFPAGWNSPALTAGQVRAIAASVAQIAV